MTIAIPLHKDEKLYHANPCTAAKFAIYAIEGDKTDLQYRLTDIVDNPWCSAKCEQFGPDQVECNCDPDRRKNIRHISEHYALLDVIGGCSYLLADNYCDNTLRALKQGGIKIFKIPPIIDKIDSAIKNFLIGASIASKVQHIHNAS